MGHFPAASNKESSEDKQIHNDSLKSILLHADRQYPGDQAKPEAKYSSINKTAQSCNLIDF